MPTSLMMGWVMESDGRGEVWEAARARARHSAETRRAAERTERSRRTEMCERSRRARAQDRDFVWDGWHGRLAMWHGEQKLCACGRSRMGAASPGPDPRTSRLRDGRDED